VANRHEDANVGRFPLFLNKELMGKGWAYGLVTAIF
jgi:hypothetical protein